MRIMLGKYRSEILILPVLVAFFALSSPLYAEDWPMFRANTLRSGNAGAVAPQFSPIGNTLWSMYFDGGIQSSPAIANNIVFFGTNDGVVHALNMGNGESVWTYPTGNWVVSSPAVWDNKVFVGSYDSKMCCLDAATGTKIWQFTTHNGIHSSPAVADGVVYFGSNDGYIYAVNIKTGWQKWRFQTKRAVMA